MNFGSNVKLKEHKKGLFPMYPLTIGAFTLLEFSIALVWEDEMDFPKLQLGLLKYTTLT